MRVSAAVLVLLILTAALPRASRPKTLNIYAIDVEGGKSTVVVSPSGESLLIDTGNIGPGAERDGNRIMAAIEDAGLHQIDHLITTHWHRDHVGAMALVAGRIPILEFIDHGANIQPNEQVDLFLQQTYPTLYGRATHTVAQAGDRIPMSDLDVRVVSSAGHVVRKPLHGAGGRNPYCAAGRPPADRTENSHSIGIHLRFGRFRMLDLGDLTMDQEFDLMCPNNSIGPVDLFMVSHHGQPSSNSKLLSTRSTRGRRS